MSGLWLALTQVAAILLAAGAVGYGLAVCFVPSTCRSERTAWGFALGLTLLASSVSLVFVIGLSPALATVLVAAIAIAAGWFLRRADQSASPLSPRGGARGVSPRFASAPAVAAGHVSREAGGRQEGVRALPAPARLFLLLAVFGVIAYALRTLTEPMWSNDFLAIWGLKGKTIFAAGAVSRRLFADPSLGFSHPEYPLGLPFLYAALCFLLGRWDDHAMALLFPFLQIATLLVLFGWLRRRGVSKILALGAVALLSLFAPLYSAFLTGMADVPYSFVALLFGTALADAVDRTDAFAARRLALASFLAISTKNEGLLLTAAGFFLAVLSLKKSRLAARRALVAIVAPALLLLLAGRLWKGSLPLRDFDLAYLGPTLVLELLPRVAEAIHTALREVILPAWPGLLCILLLVAAGRRTPAGDRLLLLASICALGYLLLPSLAVLGPDWLIRTALSRTVSALAPLTAAGIALRLRIEQSSITSCVATAAAGDPRESEGHRGEETPWNRES